MEFSPLWELSRAGSLALILVAPIVIFGLLVVYNKVSSRVRYHYAVQKQLSPDCSSLYRPAHIPYSLPFLGSAFKFLNKNPGNFWGWLLKNHPLSTGACTILMGGRTTHLIFSPMATQALFKARSADAMDFNKDIIVKLFGIPKDDYTKFEPTLRAQYLFWEEWLLKSSIVNEITPTYLRFLTEGLNAEHGLQSAQGVETGLYRLIRRVAFAASTRTFFGERMIEVMPDLERDFYIFDEDMLDLFFGIPKWMNPKIYQARKDLIGGFVKWYETTLEECKHDIPDPNTVEWEPILGSRVNRKRQLNFKDLKISHEGKASLDLGFVFGISSNVIPLMGWVMFHILDPNSPDKTLKEDIMQEIETSFQADGSLHVPTIMSQPLLQSIIHEALRFYVDGLPSRILHDDINLPLEDGKHQLQLRKGETTMSPTWLAHRTDEFWKGVSPSEFNARRFFKVDLETGKKSFTTNSANGALIPFGGGRSMCPGRTFARQEVLVTIATLLKQYDIDVLGYVDKSDKPSDNFPSLDNRYPGTAVMAMAGDMRVQIRQKK